MIGALVGAIAMGAVASGIFYIVFRKFGPFVKLFLFKK